MAAVSPIFQTYPNQVVVYTWSPLTTTNTTGVSISLPWLSDKAIHCKGTFGVSGTLALFGSNDNLTFQQLRDPLGNNLQFTAETLKQILENPLYIQPQLVSGGDGTTSITFILVARSATRFM